MTPHARVRVRSAASGHDTLRVPDVAEAKAEAAGVAVNDMWDRLPRAGVSDPAGNRILLHHRYASYPDGTKP